MKTLKNFVVLFFVIIFVASCNNSENNVSPNSSKLTLKNGQSNILEELRIEQENPTEYGKFLKDFYESRGEILDLFSGHENYLPTHKTQPYLVHTKDKSYELVFYILLETDGKTNLFATAIKEVGNGDGEENIGIKRTKEEHDAAMRNCSKDNFDPMAIGVCWSIEWRNTINGCRGSFGNCVHCWYDCKW